jgi:hypothetical protein
MLPWSICLFCLINRCSVCVMVGTFLFSVNYHMKLVSCNITNYVTYKGQEWFIVTSNSGLPLEI